MRLEADGCTLRSWCETDVPAIVACCRDPEIARWLPNIPQPYSEGDARTFVLHSIEAYETGAEAQFAIVDEHDTLVGSVGLMLGLEPVTVGYWVAREARGRGIARAATSTVVEWAFASQGVARIELHAAPSNLASQRVAASCGFRRVPGEVRLAAGVELWVYERTA